MATLDEVVALTKSKPEATAKELAAELGISVNGLYNHLRRGGIKVGGKARRGRPAKRRTTTNGAAPAVIAPLEPGMADVPIPDVSEALNGEHPAMAHLRSQIGDLIEGVESDLYVKRQEVKALVRQHKHFYAMLTTPLPDEDDE
jgi:predicted ArsR family transcriptional regulator